MRERHELERGIICEKCLNFASKKEYTRINFIKPIAEDSTGMTKVVSRMNLCNDCYEEFKEVIESFTGKKFLEKNDTKQKKDELKRLRDEIIKNQNNEEELISKNKKSI